MSTAQRDAHHRPHDRSWWRATSRSLSARISPSSWTTESGGRPPSFSDRAHRPAVGWKRIPELLRRDLRG